MSRGAARAARGLVFVAGAAVLAGCGKKHKSSPAAGPAGDASAAFSGGSGGATIPDISGQAYASPLLDLDDQDQDRFSDGDRLFESPFVDASSGPSAGLGPLYNNVSCRSCHTAAARGFPTFDDGTGSEMLIFVSVAGGGQPTEPGGPIPAPGLGLQIQDHAIYGQTPNATAKIDWTQETHTYGDGTPYSLRRPKVTVTMADGTPLPAGVLTSPRQPVPIFGDGLLEAIPDSAIEAMAARTDKVPGQVSRTYSLETKAPAIGRFGRKAARPTVREQVGKALDLDIGITNDLFPDPSGAPPKISHDDFETLTFYVRDLGVPARRDLDDPEVQRGEQLFHQFGCVGCHQPTYVTGPSSEPAFDHQTIHPYSDLLLHDLGPDMADGRPEFSASGSQWRTAALWGIGLAQTVRPGVSYLHDGRARTLPEAILWHGGQAEGVREAFRKAPAADRAALIKFLESL